MELASEFQPVCIATQEIKMKQNQVFKLDNFTFEFKAQKLKQNQIAQGVLVSL